jgi:hypothetical protein
MLHITEEQLTEIKSYLSEIPFKYALPLFQYLEKLEQGSKSEGQTQN